jgi:hypothetical protein
MCSFFFGFAIVGWSLREVAVSVREVAAALSKARRLVDQTHRIFFQPAGAVSEFRESRHHPASFDAKRWKMVLKLNWCHF